MPRWSIQASRHVDNLVSANYSTTLASIIVLSKHLIHNTGAGLGSDPDTLTVFLTRYDTGASKGSSEQTWEDQMAAIGKFSSVVVPDISLV